MTAAAPKRRSIRLALASLGLAVAATGCANPQKNIVGTFVRQGTVEQKAPFDVISFCPDRTFTAGMNYEGQPRFISGSYSLYQSDDDISQHMLRLHTSEGDAAFPYFLFDSTFESGTWVYEDGMNVYSEVGTARFLRYAPIDGVASSQTIKQMHY